MFMAFTCLLRPNSLHRLKYWHLLFHALEDTSRNLWIEIEVAVPNSKSMVYAAATGGLARMLQEHKNREMCVVFPVVALAAKTDLFVGGFKEAYANRKFVVKSEAKRITGGSICYSDQTENEH